MTLATEGFERFGKTTRRAAFPAEMERVAPWGGLCPSIDPVYPKPGNGHPPRSGLGGLTVALRLACGGEGHAESQPAHFVAFLMTNA